MRRLCLEQVGAMKMLPLLKILASVLFTPMVTAVAATMLTAVVTASATAGEKPAAVKTGSGEALNADAAPAEDKQPSLDVARDRAKVMHNIYAATLEVLHERYFHGPRAMVPARAMQDIFATIKQQSKVEAHWISVNMKPMSINHTPKTSFEKQAARHIAAGKSSFEAVEEGYYRRAGAIPLGSGCVGCHGGFFKEPSKKPKFAALIISVPVHKLPAEKLQSKKK